MVGVIRKSEADALASTQVGSGMGSANIERILEREIELERLRALQTIRTGKPIRIPATVDAAFHQMRESLRSAGRAFLELEIAVHQLELDRYDLLQSRERVGRPIPVPKD